MAGQAGMTPSSNPPQKRARRTRIKVLDKDDRKRLRAYVNGIVKQIEDVGPHVLSEWLYQAPMKCLCAPENEDIAAEIGFPKVIDAIDNSFARKMNKYDEESLRCKIAEYDDETRLLGICDRRLVRTSFNLTMSAWELWYTGGVCIYVFIDALSIWNHSPVFCDTLSMWTYKDNSIQDEIAARLDDAMTLRC